MRDGFDRDMIKSGEDEKGETVWNVRHYILFMRTRTRISVVSGQAGSEATGLLKYAWQRTETYQQQIVNVTRQRRCQSTSATYS